MQGFLNSIVSWLSMGAVVLGCVVMLISCIGMVRLPDFYTRSHAVGKGMTLGISLLLIGLWLAHSPEVSGLKIFITIFFQFITIPVASHLLLQLAHRRSGEKSPPAPGP